MWRKNSFFLVTAHLQTEVKIPQNSAYPNSKGGTQPKAPQPHRAVSGTLTGQSSTRKTKVSTAREVKTNNLSITAH